MNGITLLNARDRNPVSFDDLMPTAHNHCRMQLDGRPTLSAHATMFEVGPAIQVLVSALDANREATRIPGWALIDTGANASSVCTNVLEKKLQLQSNGEIEIVGSAGPTTHATYACEIGFPNTTIPAARLPNAIASSLHSTIFIALLGRDFLRDKVLIVNGVEGCYTLCW